MKTFTFILSIVTTVWFFIQTGFAQNPALVSDVNATPVIPEVTTTIDISSLAQGNYLLQEEAGDLSAGHIRVSKNCDSEHFKSSLNNL